MSRSREYAKAYSKPLAGLLLIGIVALAMILDYTGTLGDLFSGGSPTVSAVFANTETLQTKDLVRVNGVDVGTVLSVQPINGDRDSLVKMSVDKDAGTLYRNASAAVLWRTVLGGAYYISIDPGTPGSGQLGSARIPASQTTSEVELDDITSIVQGGAKTGLQNLFPALGQALKNPHVLGNLLTQLNQVAPSITTGVGALRGEVQDTDLQGLVKNADATVRALDAPDNQLRDTVSGAAATLDTISGNSAALEDTLATAPTTERIADQTLTQLDTTLDLANPLIKRLEQPSTQIAPTVTALQPVVTKANTLLNSAVPLLASLHTALPQLATASTRSTSVITSLQPSLTQLQGQVLPSLLAIDPSTQHSAAEMVGSGLGGLAEAAAPEDENGHFIYFPAASGNESTYLPCNEYLGNNQEQLVQCESLSTIIGNAFTYDPLGNGAGTASSTGQSALPPGLAGARKSGKTAARKSERK